MAFLVQTTNSIARLVWDLLTHRMADRAKPHIDLSGLPDQVLLDCGVYREEIGPITKLRRSATE